jgi:hypothetical protein
MPSRRGASVKVSGSVDQPTMDTLRARLQLKPEGRITDDWDQIFGRGEVSTDYGPVKTMLVRNDDETDIPMWNVDLYLEDGLPWAALSAAEREVSAAIEASGLAVSQVIRAPAPN